MVRRVTITAFILLFVVLGMPQRLGRDLPSDDISDYIRPYEPAVVELARKIGKEPFSDNLLENIKLAYYWVSNNIMYVSDMDMWGVRDYWQLPSTTIRLGTGDCEDQAILLASLLRALGVPRENVRVVFGWISLLWGEYVGHHVWVEVKIPREWGRTFGLGDRDGWIPLDTTLRIFSRTAYYVRGTYLIPVSFYLWLWLGYFTYYLWFINAIPESFYIDKP